MRKNVVEETWGACLGDENVESTINLLSFCKNNNLL